MIANVSHELRSPLSLIRGYSEMIRDVTGDNSKLRNENLDLIISETQRLSMMVDDIMDYSKMQSGYYELKIASVNLVDLVKNTVEMEKINAAQYDQKLRFYSSSIQIIVDIDPIKISQVIQNLLSNAINHSENGREIDFSINEKGDTILVSVENPGSEIPDEMKELIWERYQQIQHQGGHKEGTGIGLAIVRTILETHQMDFGVRSKNGINCFWFEVKKSIK